MVADGGFCMTDIPEWIKVNKPKALEDMAVVSVSIPLRVKKAIMAEAENIGTSVSTLLALALIEGRPDWPWKAES